MDHVRRWDLQHLGAGSHLKRRSEVCSAAWRGFISIVAEFPGPKKLNLVLIVR